MIPIFVEKMLTLQITIAKKRIIFTWDFLAKFWQAALAGHWADR